MWTVVLALLPVLLVSFFFSGFNAFRVLTIALASALLTEMAMRKILGNRVTLYDGSATITAILIALLVPSTLPSWMIALGSAFGIVMGKEIFGGLGQNIFNPALVGVSFLLLSFPSAREIFLAPTQTLEIVVSIVTLLLGGVFLWTKRLIVWEIPLLYLGAVGLLSIVLIPAEINSLFSKPILLAAFFIVTDPVTTPLTRTGSRRFALGAGLLTAAFRLAVGPAEALTSGILLMNGLSPWLDRPFHPHR